VGRAFVAVGGRDVTIGSLCGALGRRSTTVWQYEHVPLVAPIVIGEPHDGQ